jgi:hypothetical protein
VPRRRASGDLGIALVELCETVDNEAVGQRSTYGKRALPVQLGARLQPLVHSERAALHGAGVLKQGFPLGCQRVSLGAGARLTRRERAVAYGVPSRASATKYRTSSQSSTGHFLNSQSLRVAMTSGVLLHRLRQPQGVPPSASDAQIIASPPFTPH